MCIVAVLLFVLESLGEGLMPTDHYFTLLHIMLLYETSHQLHTIQTILRDAQPLAKTLLERIITTLSQLAFTCAFLYSSSPADPIDHRTAARKGIVRVITPILIRSLASPKTTSGEREACEEAVDLMLEHPSDVLFEIRKEIETMNVEMYSDS